MDWIAILLLLIGGLMALMLIRVPVAFAFMIVNMTAVCFIWEPEKGLIQIIKSIETALTSFSLTPIVLFVLMGEVMFRTGVAPRMIETVDKWLGRLPGRLSLVAIGGGALLSTLTGSSAASTAMLGSTLIPEMTKKNYQSPMTMGPVMASGTLAVMIPPSALGVLLASIGKISIGKFMVAIVFPGILMATIFIAYIVTRAVIQPELAPAYAVSSLRLKDKVIAGLIYILPLGIIVFCVVGLIFMGIATPTQSAALGVFTSMLLAAGYKQLTFSAMQRALHETMKVSVMILMIVAGSSIFSQILAFSGVSLHIVSVVSDLNMPPIPTVLLMLFIIVCMGAFMESLSILMITLPIFIPIAQALDVDLMWFATLVLITIEFGFISPPFGIGLFVMKGVMPADVSMVQVYKAAAPFLCLNLLVIAIIMAFPALAVWLPSVM